MRNNEELENEIKNKLKDLKARLEKAKEDIETTKKAVPAKPVKAIKGADVNDTKLAHKVAAAKDALKKSGVSFAAAKLARTAAKKGSQKPRRLRIEQKVTRKCKELCA
jgi:predicted phage gp36 major capsid-like protein